MDFTFDTGLENGYQYGKKRWTLSIVARTSGATITPTVSVLENDSLSSPSIWSLVLALKNITSNFVRYSWTFDVPDIFAANAAKALTSIFVVEFAVTTPTQMDVSAIQLEEGQDISRYEWRPEALEHLLIHRYYETGLAGQTSYWQANQRVETANNFSVTKRVVPTIKYDEVTIANMKTDSAHVNAVFDSSVFQGYTKDTGQGDGHWLVIWHASAEIGL